MTAHYKPTTANEIIREHAEQVVRDSRCEHISEDGRSRCRFLKGHDGPHGQHMNVTRPEQCANCGKVKAEHTREGDAWYCWPRSDFPTTSSMTSGRYLERFVPPASAPATTAGTETLCAYCDERPVRGGAEFCSRECANEARLHCERPTGEEAENADAILTDAVIGTFYDAANDAKKDAGGSLFYRWNDPTPAWQEGIGKAFFRDFALRIAGHVASRYAAEYTAQATELAALRNVAAWFVGGTTTLNRLLALPATERDQAIIAEWKRRQDETDAVVNGYLRESLAALRARVRNLAEDALAAAYSEGATDADPMASDSRRTRITTRAQAAKQALLAALAPRQTTEGHDA